VEVKILPQKPRFEDRGHRIAGGLIAIDSMNGSLFCGPKRRMTDVSVQSLVEQSEVQRFEPSTRRQMVEFLASDRETTVYLLNGDSIVRDFS
jgi:hypothetical protein